MAAGILNEQLQQEHSCSWVEGGSVTGIDSIKMLLGLGIIVATFGIVCVVYYLRRVIGAIQELHSDISVIRLDNSRTMAELRRRHR